MDLGIRDRVALVTGGSKGIGAGIAAALAAEGVKVALTSRDAAAADHVAARLDGARGYAFDSDDLDAVPGLVERIAADLGPIDIYVANTGGPPAGDPLEFTRAQWEAAHRTLVLSPLALIERVLPSMRDRGFGRILATGSLAVREPIDTLQLSNTHRPGLVAAFKVLARKVAADGVTLNTLHPGRIATDRMIETSGSVEAAETMARESIPAARLGTVEEMGAAAAFLCSVPAAYITGTTLLVDGGVGRSI